jgi:hypothetical protein
LTRKLHSARWNAEIDFEDIHEVLVGACADRTLISELFKSSEDFPIRTKSTILSHLREKFDLTSVERVGNTPLKKEFKRFFLSRWRLGSVTTFTCGPSYGNDDETNSLSHSEAKRGITMIHACTTLYARMKTSRYTLVVRRLVDGDAASSVFVGFLGFLNNLDLKFYDSRCLTLLHVHNYAYIMPVVRWGKTIR